MLVRTDEKENVLKTRIWCGLRLAITRPATTSACQPMDSRLTCDFRVRKPPWIVSFKELTIFTRLINTFVDFYLAVRSIKAWWAQTAVSHVGDVLASRSVTAWLIAASMNRLRLAQPTVETSRTLATTR